MSFRQPVTGIVVVLILLVGACGDESTAGLCAGAGSATSSEQGPSLDETAEISIAEFLTSDDRVSQFRSIVEETDSPGLRRSWLEIWDMDAGEMGDHREGVTVFVPTDAAFDRVDPEIRDALVEARVENELRYTFLGHHYVHRLYPRTAFEAGPQRTFRGGGDVVLDLDALTWAGCPIVVTDIRLANGYVHLLDGVVLPDDVRAGIVGQAG
jgi:uncharacterized surface protein with fasciclin (FAS1) repeats